MKKYDPQWLGEFKDLVLLGVMILGILFLLINFYQFVMGQ